ncbi:MAG: hypothetical protein CMO57_10265 [Verrucomicrobiales bacterium]|nr:hypothetical protein [Verrucomicrobiales bacterium]|tara:strand:+ start:2171 stop:2551 length:381 start_codon:yes stop_codon:yes gene_type:complete
MLWGFLILLLAGGVFLSSIMMDDVDMAKIFMQMGFGGALGVVVGLAVFVYVAGLVYGMSSPNGRKALLGIGVFTILFGLAFLMYYPELNAVLTFLPSAEDVEPMPFVGLPIMATGGLMCKLGSLKD